MRILVTGGAGFIGSNLVEKLLDEPNIELVRVFDNLATGYRQNVEEFFSNPKFQFLQGDIRDYDSCLEACGDIDLISHQAALGSVPRSINDPLTTNEVNVTGTLNIFTAAKEKKIRRVVYASSSSVYGDHPDLPKREQNTGNLLSPYAVSKAVDELYAQVYSRIFPVEFIGLRYFNVFGPKQSPDGPYAAVIPLFVRAILNRTSPTINGDGEHSRDFTYVTNAVDANINALFTENNNAINQVYNIACGAQTSLNQLVEILKNISGVNVSVTYGAERAGDVKHSLADISKAKNLLGFNPSVSIEDGLKETLRWHKERSVEVRSL